MPKTLPPYTEDSDIEKLLEVIPKKRSHKGCIKRDQLMVLVACKTGLRRAELANLLVRDVHGDAVIVRGGKNKKDRMVGLPPKVAKLHDFIKNKKPDDKVFGLTPESLGMKIKQFAVKAGLSTLHTHTLRHKFATDVLESGTNIKVLQTLLGHENLNTTEIYLSLTDRELYAAAKRLDEHHDTVNTKHERGKEDSEKLSVHPVSRSSTNGNRDPWIEALRVAVDPVNLNQALDPKKVEEVEFAKLPVFAKNDADHFRKLLKNDV